MKDVRNPAKDTKFDRRIHYRKEGGYKCTYCSTHNHDCFFPKQIPPGRRSICTSCKRLKKGCQFAQRMSASPELDRHNNNEVDDVAVQRQAVRQPKQNTSTSLGKRKVRFPEPTTMDHESRHDSDSDSNTPLPVQKQVVRQPRQNTNISLGKRKVQFPEPATMDHESRHDSDSYFNTPPPASSSRIPRSATFIADRKVAIPSAFRLSSGYNPAHTNPHEIHSDEFIIPSPIQLSSSSTSARINPTAPQAPPTNFFPSSNQPSSSSISSALAPTNPPHETQPEAPICTALRQMEHVNAAMVTLFEALEGEIREAEEADRTRRVRIYRIESAMKMMNQDVRAADNVFDANVPISVEDSARLDPELDRYRKMLATLQDRRVQRDRAAQERQRREQEHRDLLDDELLGRLGKR